MQYIIRKQKMSDCFDIVKVGAISWGESYRGIVLDKDIEERFNTIEERAKNDLENFDEQNNNCFVLEVDNQVVGFVRFGEAKSLTDLSNCGEIYALYILGDYKGCGFGRKLVESAIVELKKMGFDKMIIACLKGNPSNEFYVHMGGKHIKDGIYKRLNLPDNIYLYENI